MQASPCDDNTSTLPFQPNSKCLTFQSIFTFHRLPTSGLVQWADSVRWVRDEQRTSDVCRFCPYHFVQSIQRETITDVDVSSCCPRGLGEHNIRQCIGPEVTITLN